MFEHRSQPLLPKKQFHQRVLRFFFYASALLGVSLATGMMGYHYTAQLGWVDAFFNASMILTGMGPVSPMPTDGAKIFAGCYALFAGLAFLSVTAVLFAPIVHRLLHLIHVDEKN
ncbi:MAG: hypothetical protein D6730_15050 [Bacteroidetes bacterium]|nr:MAG: hypothetical protein D6730_15050 [Bacteroidota bacterium]